MLGIKCTKAFPLPAMEFPLLGEVPTASEESSHCQKKSEATAVKIELLLKSRRNCQSKSNDSYTKIETTEEGTKILATVDGNLRTVTESSIRQNLKPNDEAGISSLPDTELFENLTLMGYNISPNQKFTFQKGTPTKPHHTPSLEAQQTSPTTHSSPSLPPVSTAPIPTVTPSDTPLLRQNNRRVRIAQSSTLPPVADDPASPLRDVSQGEACPTISSFGAEQDMANIAKTSTLPHESTSRVTSLAADEGSLQLRFQELTDLCTSLQRQQSELVSKFEAQALDIIELKARVKFLEDRRGRGITHSGDDAPIKGRRLDEREVAAERLSSDTEEIRLDEEEAAAERVSDDTEEMATVLTTMDAASVLLSRGVQVVPTAAAVATATVSIPTDSGVVPTASPTIPTVAPIFATATTVTSYTRRKGKEKMVESETPKKRKIQEQDEEIAKIHAEEELQKMIEGLDRSNEIIAKHLNEYKQAAAELSIRERIELINELVKYQDHHSKILQYQAQQRKPQTKKQKRDYYMAVIRSYLERFKRKGIRFEQESEKKLKTSEEVPEEVKTPDEVPEEKVKEMMQLVPIEEVYVEALQVKHPIIDWKVHTKGQRSYWKITRLGGSSASYQFFVNLLNHLDREDLNRLWALVKETLSIRPASNEKEIELWVELKRLYEPDVEDQLWTHTQHVMHAPVECKVYDLCGVHHVIFMDQEIFMLVEKDYPLRKALALVMICYKLQKRNLLWKLNCKWSIKFRGGLLGIKCTKQFPLPVMEFPLLGEVPTASEESSHCQ
nr:hypothetical protein [Tanacetum cinerariifolium]